MLLQLYSDTVIVVFVFENELEYQKTFWKHYPTLGLADFKEFVLLTDC